MKKIFKINKILVGIDETPQSEKAIAYGYQLAKKLGAKLGLVHIDELPLVPTYVGNPIMGEAPQLLPDLLSIEEENTRKLIEHIRKNLGDEVDLETFTRLGNVKDELLALAKKWKADLLILGTHGRTGWNHFILGSVAESIVRRSACPVLIVPTKYKKSH